MSLPVGKNPFVWFDATDSSSITASGTNVTAWTNKGTSGGTNTVYTANKPSTGIVTYNSKNMLGFGTTTSASIPNIVIPSNQIFAFAVTKIKTVVDYLGFFNGFQSGALNWIWSPNEMWGGPNGISVNVSARGLPNIVAQSSPSMLLWQNSAAIGNAVKVNGTSYALFDNTFYGYNTTDGRTYYMNNYNSGSQDIGEILIFSTNLTSNEILGIEGYLAWKWGIQSKLPSGHAYYPVAVSVNSPSYAEGTVSLTWTAGIYTSFKVYRDTQSSGATKTALGTTSSASYSDSTVSPGTTYYYFVEGAIQGTFSDIMSTVVSVETTTASAPGVPTVVSATPGNGQATVSFTAPESNGGSVITGYTVTSTPGNHTGTGASSPITVSNLTNGTSYTFTVVATNAAGTSLASDGSSPITPFTTPAAPTGVSATPESLRALVTWTKPANNGRTITSYTVTSSPGAITATVNGENNTGTYVYGLTNNTAYTFTVKATNEAGDSSASPASLSATPIADAPTTAVVNAVANTDPTIISTYVNSATATTPDQQTDLAVDMRTSLNAGTVGANTQQKVDTKLAYINSMRTKVGADSFTIPQERFTEFIRTLNTVTQEQLTAKPIRAFLPTFTGTAATIDVSAVSDTNYVHFEVPIGYTITLQNGAESIALTYNGTNYSDGSNTYTVGSVIILGNKTFSLIGIGSSEFEVTNTEEVICVTKGSMIQTPSGAAAVETLRAGDKVITGDGRAVRITKMKQIVVVSATPINAPYVIEQGAFGVNMPPSRLEVSPRHAIQLPNGLWEIPREAAKENKLVHQNKDVIGKTVVYYHYSLPNYASDTTIVNGLITEALNDGQVKESYTWNNEKRGYVRHCNVIVSKHK
jgi:hypothetical protein